MQILVVSGQALLRNKQILTVVFSNNQKTCRANLITLQIIDAVHNSNFEEYQPTTDATCWVEIKYCK